MQVLHYDFYFLQVNGDTLFMTGNFKEFKVESHESNTTWDEHNARTSTVICIYFSKVKILRSRIIPLFVLNITSIVSGLSCQHR